MSQTTDIKDEHIDTCDSHDDDDNKYHEFDEIDTLYTQLQKQVSTLEQRSHHMKIGALLSLMARTKTLNQRLQHLFSRAQDEMNHLSQDKNIS